MAMIRNSIFSSTSCVFRIHRSLSLSQHKLNKESSQTKNELYIRDMIGSLQRIKSQTPQVEKHLKKRRGISSELSAPSSQPAKEIVAPPIHVEKQNREEQFSMFLPEIVHQKLPLFYERDLEEAIGQELEKEAKLAYESPVTDVVDDTDTISESVEKLGYHLRNIPLSKVKSSTNSSAIATSSSGSGAMHLAPFVRRDECLQKLVGLGVNLHTAGCKPGAAKMLAHLDWGRQVYPVLEWMNNKNFELHHVKEILSHFPGILKIQLDELEKRWQYFIDKDFPADKLAEMFAEEPEILSHSASSMDTKLGLLQQIFQFSARQLRMVVLTAPATLLEDHIQLKSILITMRRSFGFKPRDISTLVVSAPQILLANLHIIEKNFRLLHIEYDLPYEAILPLQIKKKSLLSTPVVHKSELIGGCGEALCAPHQMLRSRMAYLKKLKRLQLDCTKPSFTPPSEIARLTTSEFSKMTKKDTDHFFAFMKTL